MIQTIRKLLSYTSPDEYCDTMTDSEVYKLNNKWLNETLIDGIPIKEKLKNDPRVVKKQKYYLDKFQTLYLERIEREINVSQRD